MLQRMVSNFGNAAPTICLPIHMALVEQHFLVVPIDFVRPICHAPRRRG